MSTVSVPTQRASLEWMAYAIHSAATVNGLPYPGQVGQNEPGSDLYVLTLWSVDDANAWADFFGAAPRNVEEFDGKRIVHRHAWNWHGWTVFITGREVVEADAAELLASIEAIPVVVINPATTAAAVRAAVGDEEWSQMSMRVRVALVTKCRNAGSVTA